MNQDMFIVFGVLVGAAALFVSNRVRADLVALAALLILQLSGVLTLPESLAGFGDPVVMVIVSMFVVSEALVHTGIAQNIGLTVLNAARGDETRVIALLMLVIGGVGAFMNSTSAMAIFIPVALSVARKAGLNRKRLLMPLSIAALISGMMTLIATGPNLIVDKALAQEGLTSFGFFSFTAFGVAVLLVGIAFMLLVGRRLLARDKRDTSGKKLRTFTDMVVSYGLGRHLHRRHVSPQSPLVDRAVARMDVRSTFGVHVVAVERKEHGNDIVQATPGTVFEAGDDILVVGTREQVDRMTEAFQLDTIPLDLPREHTRRRQEFIQEIGLAEIMIVPESKLIGKTLGETHFQEVYNATVVAIRRQGEPITGRLHDEALKLGDALLINAKWADILSLRNERQNFVVLTLPEEFEDVAPAAGRAKWAVVILAAMVAAMAFRIVPTATAAMLAVLALVASGSVRLASLYRVIQWPAVVLIAAVLPMATALEKTGAAELIAGVLVDVLGHTGPFGMLAIIFAVAAVTGFFISNTPTAVLFAPVAINVAQALGVSPQAFAMTVAIACSAAYVSPVASPVNMLVLEPGGYKFVDFIKVGLPLLILTLAVTIVLSWAIYMK